LADDMRFFNVSSGTYMFTTEERTTLTIVFDVDQISGQFGVAKPDVSSFSNYAIPNGLNYVVDVFEFDMRPANPTNVKFTLTHDFLIGVENIDPKTMALAQVDLQTKKMTVLDFSSGDYYNKWATLIQNVITQSTNGIFTLALVGKYTQIESQFGQSTLISYRSSIQYPVDQKLKQYLCVYINRNLNYPSHEYTTTSLSWDNSFTLPSKDMVVLLRFKVYPMFEATYNKYPVNDFSFGFDPVLGFEDLNGNTVNIDPSTLDCLYAGPNSKVYNPQYQNVVYKDRLECGQVIGKRDFFPDSIVIVAKKANGPTPQPSSPQPSPKSSVSSSGSGNPNNRRDISPHPSNGARRVCGQMMIWLYLFMWIML